mmetsp:Transcript_18827/g.40885  ORF Transcript_18827/g.40885 Transcript_18827/m.40885 type:complete len:356 (+) Transcript_18827:164-1231(+)
MATVTPWPSLRLKWLTLSDTTEECSLFLESWPSNAPSRRTPRTPQMALTPSSLLSTPRATWRCTSRRPTRLCSACGPCTSASAAEPSPWLTSSVSNSPERYPTPFSSSFPSARTEGSPQHGTTSSLFVGGAKTTELKCTWMVRDCGRCSRSMPDPTGTSRRCSTRCTSRCTRVSGPWSGLCWSPPATTWLHVASGGDASAAPSSRRSLPSPAHTCALQTTLTALPSAPPSCRASSNGSRRLKGRKGCSGSSLPSQPRRSSISTFAQLERVSSEHETRCRRPPALLCSRVCVKHGAMRATGNGRWDRTTSLFPTTSLWKGGPVFWPFSHDPSELCSPAVPCWCTMLCTSLDEVFYV